MNVLEVCDNHVLNFVLDIVRQFKIIAMVMEEQLEFY